MTATGRRRGAPRGSAPGLRASTRRDRGGRRDRGRAARGVRRRGRSRLPAARAGAGLPVARPGLALPVGPPTVGLPAVAEHARPSAGHVGRVPPSRRPPPAAPPTTAAGRTPTATRSPGELPGTCFGAVRYDLVLAETELALLRSLCFATGGVLRIRGIGPGEVGVDREDLVSRHYEAGVVDIRFVRPGTVDVPIPQGGTTHHGHGGGALAPTEGGGAPAPAYAPGASAPHGDRAGERAERGGPRES